MMQGAIGSPEMFCTLPPTAKARPDGVKMMGSLVLLLLLLLLLGLRFKLLLLLLVTDTEEEEGEIVDACGRR